MCVGRVKVCHHKILRIVLCKSSGKTFELMIYPGNQYVLCAYINIVKDITYNRTSRMVNIGMMAACTYLVFRIVVSF